MMNAFSYTLIKQDGQGRLGRIDTAHGPIRTPAFMPVGTAASVKAMMPDSVAKTGADSILANTFHLMLRPGSEQIERFGGVRAFMNWKGPLLTDSGGYQVMSLGELRTIKEEGVRFRSPVGGQYHVLTPERSVVIQHQLGATITMVFDECISFPATHEATADSMALSMRWAERSKQAFTPREGYALFGIVQGGVYEELRRQSAARLQEIGFDGYAVGGLAVGEGHPEMCRVLDFTIPALPPDKPRYLMGVGKPPDIVESVRRGVDMFDCVLPTRSGRTSQAFTRFGQLNMRNARHRDDMRPLDAACTCPTCRDYSRAYLHHLTMCKEMQGAMLLTWHNLHYYQELMQGLRAAIEHGRLSAFTTDFYRAYEKGDAI